VPARVNRHLARARGLSPRRRSHPAPKPDLRATLAAALKAEDLAAIRAAVSTAVRILGDKAGEPEVADRYTPATGAGRWLTPTEAQAGFAPHFGRLEKLAWWRVGLDPTKLTQALRAPASVLAGHVAAARAQLDGAERSLALAKDAAVFLQWTQTQAGAGLFPFPAARASSSDRAMQVGADFLARAERAGQLDRVVEKRLGHRRSRRRRPPVRQRRMRRRDVRVSPAHW